LVTSQGYIKHHRAFTKEEYSPRAL
jgi:hypothetical protein